MPDLNNFVKYLGVPNSRSLLVNESKNPEEGMQQLVDSNKEPRDRVDIEIETIRMLMVKMSQKIHEDKRNILSIFKDVYFLL